MPALIPLPTALRRPEGPESTAYFPKPGRTPPARLQLAPPLEDERTVYVRSDGNARWKDIAQLRGEVPAAKPKVARSVAPAPFVPPYLRKGYRWDLLGDALHQHMRQELGKAAAIRSCPPTLVKLLNTPEWKGSVVSDPSEQEMAGLKRSVTRALMDAQAAVHAAKGKANKARAESYVAAQQSRLDRLHEARRVVHPSGAVLLWHPL